MCVSAVREGGLLWLAERDGMFGRWADESCGVGTAVEICRYPLKAGGPPSDFIQPSLNNALPTSPHLLPAQVHPQPLRCPPTQAAFLFCLSLNITYPHSAPVHILTPICRNLSTSVYTYTTHWKKKTLPVTLFLIFSPFHLLWPPPTLHRPGKHNLLNERIWLSKTNHKPETSKLTTYAAHLPFTIPARIVSPLPLHPPTQL